ncbi:MAG: hypothetical protein RR225_04985 [Clostridium sp.]
MMKDRIKVASDFFLAAIDKETENIAGFLNGIITDEYSFRDELCFEHMMHHWR